MGRHKGVSEIGSWGFFGIMLEKQAHRFAVAPMMDWTTNPLFSSVS
jgi:hypothetical protein